MVKNENNVTVRPKSSCGRSQGWSTSRLQEVVIDYRDLTGKSLVFWIDGRFIESGRKWKFNCTLYFFPLS